jgi:hypothetical protein
MDPLYYIPKHKGTNSVSYSPEYFDTIEEWIGAWQELEFNPKPPTYWMNRKRSEGSVEGKSYTDAALGMIWFQRYDRGRRATIWLQAPDQDFFDAGYRR